MKTTTKASKRSPRTPIFAPSSLAIDLGKFKGAACAFDPESGGRYRGEHLTELRLCLMMARSVMRRRVNRSGANIAGIPPGCKVNGNRFPRMRETRPGAGIFKAPTQYPLNSG